MRRLPAAVALLAGLAGATPASASVRVDARQVVVSARRASAVVERHPFRLTFRDARGRIALAESPNTGQPPLPLAPTPAPVPLDPATPPRPALYAPLVLTVGSGRDVQYPAGQYEGNELTGVEGGVQYSARDVVAVRREGRGVRLEISTSDPAGRRLAVTIAPRGADALGVSVRPTGGEGVSSLADSFVSDPREAFRGFGGRHNALDQRGQDFFNWLTQESTGAGQLSPANDASPAGSGDRFLFPSDPQAAYYVQSSFVSSAGYGFLLARDELSRWRMASDRPDAWQVAVAGPALDYVVVPGGPRRAIRRLTEITGRQSVPPTWALGPQLDRAVKYPSDNPADYAAAVRDDLDHIARGDAPVSAYRLEGWQFLPRPVLAELIGRMRRMGIHPLVYFRGFVGKDTIGTDDPAAYDYAVGHGYVARTATGQPYVFVSNFNAPAAVIDFTNPAAVRWWQGRIREALDLGADGFMQDFGEQVQRDMRFFDGTTGAQMHNRFPVLFHRATREVLDAYSREHPRRSLFFFTRSGYSGTPGSAAYEYANFPGDETTDFSRSSGLASLATDMLDRAVGGAYGYGTDIGGYFDLGPYQPTTKELFLRWAEWAALSPLFRLHGSVGAGVHTPWSFDAETVRVYRRLSRLHLRAVPLIRRLWRAARRTGLPPTRPLWLAYPRDARAAREDQEWLLGPDVLVAPVVAQGATTREVYLPRGCWRRAGTKERRRGPATVRVEAPLGALPWFERCGTAPLGRAQRRR